MRGEGPRLRPVANRRVKGKTGCFLACPQCMRIITVPVRLAERLFRPTSPGCLSLGIHAPFFRSCTNITERSLESTQAG
jgi:hypothetical protein